MCISYQFILNATGRSTKEKQMKKVKLREIKVTHNKFSLIVTYLNNLVIKRVFSSSVSFAFSSNTIGRVFTFNESRTIAKKFRDGST